MDAYRRKIYPSCVCLRFSTQKPGPQGSTRAAWFMRVPSTLPDWFNKTKIEVQRAIHHLKLPHYFLGKKRNTGVLGFLPSASCSMGWELYTEDEDLPLGGLPASDTPHWQRWRAPDSLVSSSSKYPFVKKWHINHHAPCPRQTLDSLSSKVPSHPHSSSSLPAIK